MAYSTLADAILGAQYIPSYTEYYSRFLTTEQKASAGAKSARRRLDRIADEVIDALARAVALAGSDPNLAKRKVLWMATLPELYQYRNSGYDTGLTEFIEGVLNKPLLARNPRP